MAVSVTVMVLRARISSTISGFSLHAVTASDMKNKNKILIKNLSKHDFITVFFSFVFIRQFPAEGILKRAAADKIKIDDYLNSNTLKKSSNYIITT